MSGELSALAIKDERPDETHSFRLPGWSLERHLTSGPQEQVNLASDGFLETVRRLMSHRENTFTVALTFRSAFACLKVGATNGGFTGSVGKHWVKTHPQHAGSGRS